MLKLEQFGDKFNELNRKITEWRPGLIFNQEVAEYQKNNPGISQDVQNLKLLRNEKELRLITPLSPKQKTFRELAAGLHEIFAPSDVTKRKTLRDEYYGRLDAMENEYEKN